MARLVKKPNQQSPQDPSPTMIRIYCDWSNRLDGERFDLGCPGSCADLERHADILKDGMRVILYQTDELEAEGIIRFDRESKRWEGTPNWSTQRFIGRSAAFERNA
jgi:hypothetical protein